MAQVSSQTELLAAISKIDSFIEILTDFEISTQMNIHYAVTISSKKTGSICTLKKGSDFNGILFCIINGGSLTLQNITLDGDKINHPETNPANRTLIFVSNGSLHLCSGTTIQNNNAYLAGGGVFISGNPSYSNQFVMNGNAVIQNCFSAADGGGIMAAVCNSADSIIITQNAVIQNNTAHNGGGIYFRIDTADAGGRLSIGDNVKISENIARNGNGGGIYFSNFTGGSFIPAQLTVFQNAVISSNSALNGAGIYFVGTFINDMFIFSNMGQIIENTANQCGGGIFLSFPSGKANVFIEGGFIFRNIAGTGGGIYFIANSGGIVHISDTTIMENIADNGIYGNGGGLWFSNISSLNQTFITVSNSFIRDNIASGCGGGIYYYIAGYHLSSFTVENSAVKSNLAKKNGGGLFMESAGGDTVKITNSRISENKSENYGGGYYLANKTKHALTAIDFTNTVITQNSSKDELRK